MEGIEHKTVHINGISMHVAQKGSEKSPVVLFLHGFPELWYSWRHQITAFASFGYRAVAPDLRGYGDTDAPTSIESYSCHHIVGDIVALIQSLGVDRVFLVAHDWGAFIGWYLCLFRPDMVRAFVSLGVPFRPRHPTTKPVETLRNLFGDDYYMCRFQEPGKIEREIARRGSETVLWKILTDRKPWPPILPKENPFEISRNAKIKLPSWLSEEDLKFYAKKYDQKRFTGGLNYYRALDLNWELTAPWTRVQVKVPVKFIVGDLDMDYNENAKNYVKHGNFKRAVPSLEEPIIMKGVGHFIHQERAEEINDHIRDFIEKFRTSK